MKGSKVFFRRLLLLFSLCMILTAGNAYAAKSGLVPVGKLANYNYFRRYMSQSELQQAYDRAESIVAPLVGMNKKDQLKGIAVGLRALVDNGSVGYSMKASHYNDPYGYLVKGMASCGQMPWVFMVASTSSAEPPWANWQSPWKRTTWMARSM